MGERMAHTHATADDRSIAIGCARAIFSFLDLSQQGDTLQ